MALHPNFPRTPYEVLPPDLRWFPAAEELRSIAYEKLLPPLVAKAREFENEWQSFRTRQNRDLELATVVHTYDRPGRYTVAVKLIDFRQRHDDARAGECW